jgi:hypothetical protein
MRNTFWEKVLDPKKKAKIPLTPEPCKGILDFQTAN